LPRTKSGTLGTELLPKLNSNQPRQQAENQSKKGRGTGKTETGT